MNISEDGLEKLELQGEKIVREHEDKLPAPPPTKESVVIEAKKTVESLERGSKSVARQVRDISRIEESMRKKAAAFLMPAMPSIAEIEGADEFQEVVEEILDIVDRYRKGDLDPALFDDDVLRLAGNLVYLSGKLSHFQNAAADKARVVDMAEARFYIDAKRAAQEEDIPLTDEGAKKLAKAHSLEIAMDASTYEMLSTYVAGVYFSVKSFVTILDNVSNRENRVNKLPQH